MNQPDDQIRFKARLKALEAAARLYSAPGRGWTRGGVTDAAAVFEAWLLRAPGAR